jgi:hypothetical protein
MRRIFSVLAVAALLAAMLVATALPAFADPLPKVTVCHLSEEGTYEAIEVSGNSVDSHLAHGDFIVVDETTPCPPLPPAEV